MTESSERSNDRRLHVPPRFDLPGSFRKQSLLEIQRRTYTPEDNVSVFNSINTSDEKKSYTFPIKKEEHVWDVLVERVQELRYKLSYQFRLLVQ